MKATRVYGPVPSRRFGLSLGIDLVPHKICNYDCIYCQLGPTPETTITRKDFAPVDEILAEVKAALDRGPRPDVLTLAGSGDPSLVASLGALIDGLHAMSDVPVVLLTNGGLLYREDVAKDALKADILAPNLDAGDPETFARINRPHADIDFESMLNGLRQACANHPGQVRIEVVIVPGINDSEASLQALASILDGLRADSIDINTPVRPSPGRELGPCSPECLKQAQKLFGPRALVVAGYRGRELPDAAQGGLLERIRATLGRRPCTLEDLHAATGANRHELIKLLEQGLDEGFLETRPGAAGAYYLMRETAAEPVARHDPDHE